MSDQGATREGQLLAAIDLGSNSFHMVVASLEQGELRPIDVISEKVQLAAGLDSDKQLSADAQQRGLDCLSRFAQRIVDLPRSAVKIVGTNALREARNSWEFCEQAEKLLDVPLEIIAGREEARLIYLGVSHTLADDLGNRLVVDIGGGSTEFIIGERFEPLQLESLHMGCVSYSRRFFPDGRVTAHAFHRAQTAALQELLTIRDSYRNLGWHSTVGSSGTIKAVRNACVHLGFCEEGLTPKALLQLRDYLINQGHTDNIALDVIKPERRQVLPGGLAILCALFESLGIERMDYSDGALREGLLYDMAGRLRHEDVRERTINALARRYHLDEQHAAQVEHSCLLLWAQAKEAWQLADAQLHDLLCWAARAHEVGLTIAHSQFHKHSAYLLQNSDLPGFSRLNQQLLAVLARGHRRKLPKEEFKLIPKRLQETVIRLCILLRLAVILCRCRSNSRLPAIDLRVEGDKLQLDFPPGWLEYHPLTCADLEQEVEYLKAIDYKLRFS